MTQDPPAAPPCAFISYARADGELFATELRRRLEREHPEISLWQDRARMKGGVGWWKQITDALDQIEVLIMVMTPGVVASEVARKEWRYARQQGARICPVMEGSVFDFSSLPSWMRKVHVYDLDKEWEAFVAFLASADKDSRVPFMAPDQRAGYVPRTSEYEALMTSLLTRQDLEPVATTVALQGSGGFGKTTLAIAVCHDDNLINAFDDGILWVTLGQKPNVQLELTKMYAALTGQRPPFVDAEDAAIGVAARLEDKNCLIVIDDAWNVHDIEPFLRGARHSARLITTRQWRIVGESRALVVAVNEMTDSESIQMLLGAFPAPPANLEPLRGLAGRLGEWPLLLTLAAAQLRARTQRGDSAAGALAFVNRGLDKRGVIAFDRANAAARNDAVATTVGASLDLLQEGDRRRCIELSILAEGRGVPMSVARTLWGIDDFDTEVLLQELDSASLVDFDLKTATLRIHDVLRAVLGSLLDDAPAVHRRLVETGWADPYALPDAYAWRWYAWHVTRGGGTETLRPLLFDIDWMQAKHRASGIHALVQDYDFLGGDADAQILQDALRLSAAALSRFPDQFATQLAARLRPGDSVLIGAMLAKAAARVPRPWLRLLHRSLTPPGGPLISILKGHTDAVEALALSPDGRRAVSGSRDGKLRVWDLDSGRIERSFENGAPVTCLDLSPDGRRVVSGSEDRAVRVWSLDAGTREAEHRHHSGLIHAIDMDPGGGIVYSLSDDGTVRAWDLGTDVVQQVLRRASHNMHAMSVTPDGRQALCGTGDMNFAAIDLDQRAVVNVFEGHGGLVRALAVSPDGRWVASGSEDNTVRIWERDTARTMCVLAGHSDAILSLGFTPDSTRVISGSADKSIRIWDVTGEHPPQTLEGHSGPVRALAAHPDGRGIISASGDRTLRIWDMAVVAVNQPSKAHQTAVTLLAVSSDGRCGVSGSARSNLLQVWDVEADRLLRTLAGGDQTHVVALAMSADGHRVLAASSDNVLRVWDLPSGNVMHVLRGHTSDIVTLAMTPDGERGISLSRDRTLRVWDLQSGRALRVARQSDHPAMSSALLDPSTGKVLDTMRVPVAHDSLVALSADGRRLLFTSESSLIVWDVDATTTWRFPLGDFDPVVLTADREGRTAVVGSRFGMVAMCQLSHSEITQLGDGRGSSICDAVITDDGCVVAASSAELRVWSQDGKGQSHALDGAWSQSMAMEISSSGATAWSIVGDTLSAAFVASGALLGSLSIDHEITALAVAGDDRVVALGDESGRVHFVRLDDG